MTITRSVAAALGAVLLFGGATGTVKAGIRGTLSVYNQSANPYHIFIEGQRMGTVLQGQTFRFPVYDLHGPTELVAIQAGSHGRIRFVRHVPTCQSARWELHTRWEQLTAYDGLEYPRPHYAGSHHGWPNHGGPHPGHGGPHRRGPHHGRSAAIAHGVGMIVRGSDPHNPHGGADISRGVVSIIAGAVGR
jgi:hypothetical protein